MSCKVKKNYILRVLRNRTKPPVKSRLRHGLFLQRGDFARQVLLMGNAMEAFLQPIHISEISMTNVL